MKTSLEKDVLRYGLILAISYQLYQSIISIFPVLYVQLALVNSIISIILILLYISTVKREHIQFTAFIAHLLALCGFTFFWVNHGGLAGTVPSFLCFYISFIVITSHGAFRIVSLALLALLVTSYFFSPTIYGMSSYEEPANISVVQKNVDYLVIGGVITLFAFFIKQKFVAYRGQSIKRNEQLTEMAKELAIRNQELALREEETRSINDNLESMVNNRTRELRMNSQALAEYAFINAHTLRGPLCRIKGIIQLMEREPQKYDLTQLAQVKKIAGEIDDQIQAINKVIS